VQDDIWLVSFMDYDLGYFDLETRVLEPLENPFWGRLFPGTPVPLFEKNPRVWVRLTVDQFLPRSHGAGCLRMQAELPAFAYAMAISALPSTPPLS
jgi:hypothetical protein